MHINTPILREQIAHQDEALVDHRDEAVRALTPGVAVGQLLEHVGFLREGLVADLDVHGEIRAHVEGWIDVDQLDAAVLLDLLPHRTILERREDELIVAPDELVRPTRLLPAPEIEQLTLQQCVLRLLLPRLVDLLDHLKGKHDVAHLVRLAVPDQLHLALVVEEEKTIFVRQRLSRLHEFYDFALFGVGEFHSEPSFKSAAYIVRSSSASSISLYTGFLPDNVVLSRKIMGTPSPRLSIMN